MKHGGLRPLLVLRRDRPSTTGGGSALPNTDQRWFQRSCVAHKLFTVAKFYAERGAVFYCFELRALRVNMSQVDSDTWPVI